MILHQVSHKLGSCGDIGKPIAVDFDSVLDTGRATSNSFCFCRSCCRYGWYPLLIAPIVSTGCLLSLYSSFGCDFVTLDVGFTPSNKAWNQSEAHLGLFYMYTGKDRGNKYADTLLEGCEWYSDSFEVSFIEGDKTWKVARIMALISGAASITAAVSGL